MAGTACQPLTQKGDWRSHFQMQIGSRERENWKCFKAKICQSLPSDILLERALHSTVSTSSSKYYRPLKSKCSNSSTLHRIIGQKAFLSKFTKTTNNLKGWSNPECALYRPSNLTFSSLIWKWEKIGNTRLS